MISPKALLLLAQLPLLIHAAPAPAPAASTYGAPSPLFIPDITSSPLLPRQNPTPAPGTEHGRILRLTACFERNNNYYLAFARYNSASRLGSYPDKIAKPARDGNRPLWEGKRVTAENGAFAADIKAGKPPAMNGFAGTAYENFYYFNCYADAQHVVYVEGGLECQSIYYCKEGGPYGG
ncbi:hypothetical protein QBC34DRAFT_462730 [Podospora aff. communis PSN243]|uniref:Uncharacterized protein n=1 Tax=Podospora aff. communis PSN243 TaxID=3040156 RepID=A0AAV9GMU4_9PEZI|nr:hypothetical protein QBC34DRAFT_462730 [Podospora aff. communis PSN243]